MLIEAEIKDDQLYKNCKVWIFICINLWLNSILLNLTSSFELTAVSYIESDCNLTIQKIHK